MLNIAVRMLFGDPAKHLGIAIGIAISSVLMVQQAAILFAVFHTLYGSITDVPLPDVWVMDPKVQMVDDARPMLDTQVYRVRGVEGVEWAVPFYKGTQRVRLHNGELISATLIGIDDATLIGGPVSMQSGTLRDLLLPDAIIVDEVSARGRLAGTQASGSIAGKALDAGDIVEINDRRAVIIGIAKTTGSFRGEPVIYTTYSRAKSLALAERKLLSYILVKTKAGENPARVARRITQLSGLGALTAQEFKDKTFWFMIDNTSMLAMFGTVVLIGFAIGTAITGQVFYNFTLENLRYFAVFKAMGGSDRLLLAMVVLQALTAGSIGFGIGAGLNATVIAFSADSLDIALSLDWRLLIASATATLLIVTVAAAISVRKVIRLDAAMAFKS